MGDGIFDKQFGCLARLLQTDFPVLCNQIHIFIADNVGDFCRIEFCSTSQ